MTNYNIHEEIENIKVMLNLLQWFFIWGGITFFISHIIIIINLPKIKKILEKICYEKENEEEKTEEKKQKENLIKCIVYGVGGGIAVVIFIWCIFL